MQSWSPSAPKQTQGTVAARKQKIEPLNDVKDKDWWTSPPPIISFVRVLRQDGGFGVAANGPEPERTATARGLTETSSPLWSIDGAF